MFFVIKSLAGRLTRRKRTEKKAMIIKMEMILNDNDSDGDDKR